MSRAPGGRAPRPLPLHCRHCVDKQHTGAKLANATSHGLCQPATRNMQISECPGWPQSLAPPCRGLAPWPRRLAGCGRGRCRAEAGRLGGRCGGEETDPIHYVQPGDGGGKYKQVPKENVGDCSSMGGRTAALL